MPFDNPNNPTVNVEAIQRVIEALRAFEDMPRQKQHKFFDMDGYIHEEDFDVCATPSCIAGWAIATHPEKFGNFNEYVSKRPDWDLDAGKLFFGESVKFADQRLTLLFHRYVVNSRKIRAHHAIAVLENLIVTGEVDWSVADAL